MASASWRMYGLTEGVEVREICDEHGINKGTGNGQMKMGVDEVGLGLFGFVWGYERARCGRRVHNIP